MVLNIGKPKESTSRWLEFIKNFVKVAEYNINTRKLIAFLYTDIAMAKHLNRKISNKQPKYPSQES